MLRNLPWTGVLSIALGCGSPADEDDVPMFGAPAGPVSVVTLDAGSPVGAMDAGLLTRPSDAGSVDAATACAPVEVCSEGKPGTLYNVCLRGGASASSAVPDCLVDSNGAVYLVSLGVGQLVVNPGWQSGASLSPDNAQRCAAARAALSADASTAPCAN